VSYALAAHRIDDDTFGAIDQLLTANADRPHLHDALKLAQAALTRCRDDDVVLVLDDICVQCAGAGYLVEPDGMGDVRDVACPSCRGARHVDVFDVLAVAGFRRRYGQS
jgi:hypothetical protein